MSRTLPDSVATALSQSQQDRNALLYAACYTELAPKPEPVKKEEPEMVHYVAYRQNRLPYCCGVHELGEFQSRLVNKRDVGGNTYAIGDSYQEAWKKALRKAIETSAGRPIQFWFYKPALRVNPKGGYIHEKKFQAQELRDLVASLPDAVCIAEEHLNVGSNNLIEGWMLFNKERKAITID